MLQQKVQLATFVFIVNSIALFSLVGCGGPAGDPDLIPVQGTVTLDGQPLKTGIIGFAPESGQAASTGKIEDGDFKLNFSQSADGAKPGLYKVSIQSWTTPPSMDANGKPVKGVLAIPEKYMSQTTSGLTANVKKEGENDFTFELKSE
ncbi:hypothetical protein [uncultured Gimesia sp.]|uniref:hypothetical protein n=1 Tax=uncultured Gimesia sp. TaxID=1678688 RepID=UPI0030DD7A5C|tara:strand:- start:76539 stop:76982 length:444 start_codon:yes stop_codon:yes gene_type:complete